MSIEDFVHRVNGLISAGRFADLGIPQVRIEGTTAWGAWLRINCRQGGFGWCPQLLCGVLFHASNRTLTFHGDAVSATSRLLPFFSSWTASTIAELAPPPRVVPPLDSAFHADPDSVSSVGDGMSSLLATSQCWRYLCCGLRKNPCKQTN